MLVALARGRGARLDARGLPGRVSGQARAHLRAARARLHTLGAAVPDLPDVVVFDVNETLSDMSPLGARFAQVGAPEHLARTWFAAVLRDGFALTAAGDPQPFATIAASVLRSVLFEAGVGDLDEAVSSVMSAFMELSVHPDVPDGVQALRGAGRTLVTLSNGSASVAEALLTRAGLREQFTHLLSVEQAGVWKPARGAYEHAATTCGVESARCLLVAVHPWDIDGASRAGMRTGYLDRSGVPYPTHLRAPDHTARTLSELATRLTS